MVPCFYSATVQTSRLRQLNVFFFFLMVGWRKRQPDCSFAAVATPVPLSSCAAAGGTATEACCARMAGYRVPTEGACIALSFCGPRPLPSCGHFFRQQLLASSRLFPARRFVIVARERTCDVQTSADTCNKWRLNQVQASRCGDAHSTAACLILSTSFHDRVAYCTARQPAKSVVTSPAAASVCSPFRNV